MHHSTRPLHPSLIRIALCVLGCTGVFTSVAQAELEWAQTLITQTAKPGQTEAEGVFGFRNATSKTITLQSVSSSCGCTTAEVAKKNYEPGESGEIRAKFQFGDRSGHQKKTVTVLTDETDAEPVLLTLEVEIPAAIEISPRVLIWQTGEPRTAKNIELRVADAAAVKIVDVQISGVDWQLTKVDPVATPPTPTESSASSATPPADPVVGAAPQIWSVIPPATPGPAGAMVKVSIQIGETTTTRAVVVRAR